RLLEEPRTRLRGLAGGAERPAAGDELENDPAAPLGVPLAHEPERPLDALGTVVRRLRQLGGGELRARDDVQQIERPGLLFDRIRRDQAERTVHESSLSASMRDI